jgi:hypothetical protein
MRRQRANSAVGAPNGEFGFKSLQAAKSVMSRIELMHMILRGQSHFAGSEEMSFADDFLALAGEVGSVCERIQNLPEFSLAVFHTAGPRKRRTCKNTHKALLPDYATRPCDVSARIIY